MLKTTDRAQAIQLMNDWGAARQPFFFLIDFEQQRPMVLRLEDIHSSELLYDIEGRGNARGLSAQDTLVEWERQPIDMARYAQAFELVQREIQAGNSYLLNLAFPTQIHTKLSLRQLFLRSRARYRIWLRGQFACFSPEPFVTIAADGRIASFPMKGTIDAGLPNARQRLLDNEKERAEHATIVDLIRNDLSMIAKGVQVARYRYIEEVATHQGGLLQSSTEIAGQLPAGFHERLGELIFALLPAGSISGAPKAKTLEIIRAAEQLPRGYYTGVCGLFDGQSLDSGVMIRFVEQGPEGLIFKSGGGITARSRMEEEYEELIRKAYLPFLPEPVLI